ncbi:MAG: type II secretion system protein [Patescibacteria group bacterium]|jgi:prepilin-type N-terminal cleavage/methylation domain-containing protein
MKSKHPNGFTLIELLVVIAIIGLLATIAVVALNSARTDARNVKRKADLSQIANALEIYYDRYGRYPDNSTATGYGEEDITNIYGFNWDLSCLEGGSKDVFLSPLTQTGIMATTPNDPLYRMTPLLCYGYTSISYPSGSALKGYYLISYLEGNAASGKNDCPILVGLGLPQQFICYHQGDMLPL